MIYTEAIEQLRSEGFFGDITLWHNGNLANDYAALIVNDDANNTSVKPNLDELQNAFDRSLIAQAILDNQNTIQENAKSSVQSIPAWAAYTEAEALDYIDTNVTDLASAIIVLKALVRIIIALRNKEWPDLEGN